MLCWEGENGLKGKRKEKKGRKREKNGEARNDDRKTQLTCIYPNFFCLHKAK